MAETKPIAKADDSHDGRYTHPSAQSPAAVTKGTAYPKWVTPPGGEAVIVQTPDEEKAVLHPKKKDSGFMRAGLAIILAGVFSILAALPLFAQTTVTQTTLTNALAAPTAGAPATTIVLGSATGINTPSSTAPGSLLFMDREAMRVQSLVTGTTFTVTRGQSGTAAAAHAAGAIVFAGPSSGTLASPFVSNDPSGVCVAASQPYTLQINPRTGNIWACTPSVVTLGTTGSTVSMWASWGFTPEYLTVPRVNVAGNVSGITGGYTIKITDYIVALTTTNTGTDTINGKAAPVTTFRLPSHAGLAGKVLVLKDESGGVGATTFINIFGTIDGTTSAQIKTAYGSITVYAGSGGWFRIAGLNIGPS